MNQGLPLGIVDSRAPGAIVGRALGNDGYRDYEIHDRCPKISAAQVDRLASKGTKFCLVKDTSMWLGWRRLE